MATTTLGSKAEGSIIKLKENGAFADFYVCKHNYESNLNGTGRTLVVRKDCYDQRQWHSSNVNALATSTLDNWFNSTYINLLDADTRAAIGQTKFYYTPGNGNNTVTTLQRAIFALSAKELGQTHTYLNAEGSVLSIADTLKFAKLNGLAVVQWTRSPFTTDTENAWGLGTNGYLNNCNCYDMHGARPAFTLPSNLFISDDGAVTYNNPPTISSDTTSGTNLGQHRTNHLQRCEKYGIIEV